MLEKPDLPDEALAGALRAAYGLDVQEIAFLPLGADWRTAVYRVVASGGGGGGARGGGGGAGGGEGEGSAYFLKLRSGAFDETAVVVPRLLHEQGVGQVIPPLPTAGGGLWTRVERFALTLYPFVQGEDGYTRALSDFQWGELGVALRRIHATRLPEEVAAHIPRDTFASTWREALGHYLERATGDRFGDPAGGADPVAAEVVGLLWAEGARIGELIRRSGELATRVGAATPRVTLCHGDWHPGNALLGADGSLHVVDWDTLVFAPHERDLALIGATWGGAREGALFYAGYGPIQPDRDALAYYRYHRIVEDLAVDCAAILDSPDGGASRVQGLGVVRRALRPGGALDVACRLDAS